MPKTTPTVSLSTKYLEDHGYRVAYVQRQVTPILKLDAFGFADFIAFKPGRPGMLMANACAWGDIAGHVKKYETNQNLIEFLGASRHNRFLILGWKRSKRTGARVRVYEWPRSNGATTCSDGSSNDLTRQSPMPTASPSL